MNDVITNEIYMYKKQLILVAIKTRCANLVHNLQQKPNELNKTMKSKKFMVKYCIFNLYRVWHKTMKMNGNFFHFPVLKTRILAGMKPNFMGLIMEQLLC